MNTKKILYTTLLFFLSISTLIAQDFLDRTLVHDGETREFAVYIPSGYDGSENISLLFNFHGGSGDIASQIGVSDMRAMADTANFIVVYPQALPDPNDDGATLWTHKEPTTVDDIYFVEAMIDDLATEYAIDQNRVYACGYSNGGEFSFELACRLSHRIAAIGVVARSMYIETYNECSPSHPMGIVTIHGTADEYEGITFLGTTYYIALDDVNAYWSNHNNTDTTPIVTELPNISSNDGSTVEHYAWQNGDACVSVEHFKVLGGGHDWPGTWGNLDIDASVEIWKYVSQYDINGRIDCSTTAIEEQMKSENELFIYPNPAENFLAIDMDITTAQTYDIYTASGKLVLSGTVDAQHKTIDVSSLPSSLYFIKIGQQTSKFFKENK
jgi:polyhydroxybutyrate depolymerase